MISPHRQGGFYYLSWETLWGETRILPCREASRGRCDGTGRTQRRGEKGGDMTTRSTQADPENYKRQALKLCEHSELCERKPPAARRRTQKNSRWAMKRRRDCNGHRHIYGEGLCCQYCLLWFLAINATSAMAKAVCSAKAGGLEFAATRHRNGLARWQTVWRGMTDVNGNSWNW